MIPGRPLAVSRTFAALRFRNYRLWFVGQMLSLIGTWTQTTAQAYLIFELTSSRQYLGYVGFSSGVSAWLLMLYGGVVADRFSRRNLLLAAQSLMMVMALILAALTFSGHIQPWQILALAFGTGVANAFDAPARQSFVLELVDREHLGNAIALNSTIFQIASAVGPAVAGLLYSSFGAAWCFTVNGLSFVAVIAALLAMRLPPRLASRPKDSPLESLREGILYARNEPSIRTLLAVASVTTLFGMAYVTLIPDWAVTVLHGDARTNGWLQSARGFGALLGALMIASLGSFESRGRLLLTGSLIFPVMLFVFASVRSLPLALISILGVGWGLMILYNMANTLVQSLVPDELRGRVLSLYTLTFFGLMPLSALWAGAVAEQIGSPTTVALGAGVSMVLAIVLWRRRPGLRALR